MHIIDENNSGNRNFKRYCILRIAQYAAVNAFLFFVNWMTSPRYWWVLWVMAGWGLGVILDLVNKWYKQAEDK